MVRSQQAPPGRGPYLTDLEVAYGLPIGLEPGTDKRPDVAVPDARAALEAVILRALQQPPCVVQFSGGRDSSMILAIAVSVARRHGLPEPIALTFRYEDAPQTEEADFQEMVARHLEITEWERVQITDEHDYLGPLAREMLEIGPVWPANLHTLFDATKRARGGSLLTGVDGDGLLGGWTFMVLSEVLRRERGPARSDLRQLARWVMPASIRGARAARGVRRPWLTNEGIHRARRAVGRWRGSEPRTWGKRVHWYRRQRYLHVTQYWADVLGEQSSCSVVQPLLDPAFLDAVTGWPSTGPGSRTAAMRLLSGDLLPDSVLARQNKATFGEAFWRTESRRFAKSWSGQGLPGGLVDAAALRRCWLNRDHPAPGSTLLQQAWRADAGMPERTPL